MKRILKSKLIISLAVICFVVAMWAGNASAKTVENIETIHMTSGDGTADIVNEFEWNETPWLYFQLPVPATNNIKWTLTYWNDPESTPYEIYDKKPDDIYIWQSLNNWEDVKKIGTWDIAVTYESQNTTGSGSTYFNVVNNTSGGSGMAPEPISSVLFVTGGVVFAGRSYLLRKKSSN